MNTVRVFSDHIVMEFGLKKCCISILRRGKVGKIEEVTLPNGHKMKSVEKDVYKYFGVLE